MKKNIKIKIESKYPYSLKKKIKLSSYGLVQDNLCFSGYVNKKEYKQLQIYCKRQNYKLRLDNQFTQRSTDYRKTFFQNYPPFINNKYFCTYCGRLLKAENITVDHLYPVNATKKSIELQKKLKRKGYSDINDVKNLVPACELCNKNKGDKIDGWIIKGKLGRHPAYWISKKLIKTAVFVAFVYLIFERIV